MSDTICRGVKDTSTGKSRVTIPLGRNLLGEVVLTRDGYLRLHNAPGERGSSTFDLSLLTVPRTQKLPDKDGTLALGSDIITDHGLLTGRSDDDHPNYPFQLGRITGQKIIGGIGAGEHLSFQSTSHATKGEVKSADLFRMQAGGAIDTGFALDVGGDTYAEGSISPKTGRNFSILGAQDTLATGGGHDVTIRGGPGGATSGDGGDVLIQGGAESGGAVAGAIKFGTPSTPAAYAELDMTAYPPDVSWSFFIPVNVLSTLYADRLDVRQYSTAGEPGTINAQEVWVNTDRHELVVGI